MSKTLGGVLAGVFVGVFSGAFALELARRAGMSRKVSEGFRAAKAAFLDGYNSADQSEEDPDADDGLPAGAA